MMEKINGNDNRQLIEAAKERLRWYTLEASEAEYDAEEVEALVQLLKCMEPVETQTDDEALERFHAYVQMREEEDEVILTELSAKQKRSTGLAVFVRTHKFIATAAAILLVVMIAGGSFGAVNAGKGNGFFYWLRKDDEGMTMITSPENMDGNKHLENEIEYQNEEDVPQEYRKYLVDVTGIKQLEEYDLKYVRINRNEEYVGIKRYFESDDKKIYIGVFIYPHQIGLARETHLSKELEVNVESKEENGLLIKENPNGGEEYTIYFYQENAQYYVEGNIEKDKMLEIAAEYKRVIIN